MPNKLLKNIANVLVPRCASISPNLHTIPKLTTGAGGRDLPSQSTTCKSTGDCLRPSVQIRHRKAQALHTASVSRSSVVKVVLRPNHFSEVSKYFSDPQYYFLVNGQYVRNKLKVVLFPFLHRGHWTRIAEPVGGNLAYKPPIHDINAPDLYIPLMAFGSYVVLTGFSLGLFGKFSPEALSLQFTKGLAGWFLQILLLKGLLYSLGREAPLLDIVAYSGYAFTGISLAVVARIFWSYSYYFLLPWMCLCMGIFLVKTMRRVLYAGMRSYEHANRSHYLLLFVAAAQFPLFFWLGNVGP